MAGIGKGRNGVAKHLNFSSGKDIENDLAPFGCTRPRRVRTFLHAIHLLFALRLVWSKIARRNTFHENPW